MRASLCKAGWVSGALALVAACSKSVEYNRVVEPTPQQSAADAGGGASAGGVASGGGGSGGAILLLGGGAAGALQAGGGGDHAGGTPGDAGGAAAGKGGAAMAAGAGGSPTAGGMAAGSGGSGVAGSSGQSAGMAGTGGQSGGHGGAMGAAGGGASGGSGAQPWQDIFDQTTPVTIAVDATHVYWVNRGSVSASGSANPDGSVMRAPLDGGPREIVAEGLTDPHGLALSETTVFWCLDAAAPSGAVQGRAKAGGEVVTVVPGQDLPWAVAVANGAIYWNTLSAIKTVPLAGDGSPLPGQFPKDVDGGGAVGGVYDLRLSWPMLYWADELGGLWRRDLSAKTAPVEIFKGGSPWELATDDGGRLFWLNHDKSAPGVGACQSPGAASPSCASLYDEPGSAIQWTYGIAAATDAVYWGSCSPSCRLLKLSSGQSTPQELATGHVGGIAIAGSFLYYSDRDAGVIRRVTR